MLVGVFPYQHLYLFAALPFALGAVVTLHHLTCSQRAAERARPELAEAQITIVIPGLRPVAASQGTGS